MHRVEVPRVQLLKERLGRIDLILKRRRIRPDARRRVRVAPARSRHPEDVRDLKRKVILLRRVRPVRNLNRVDVLEHFHLLGRLLRRQLELLTRPHRRHRVEQPPERVRHHHESAVLIRRLTQLLQSANPRQVSR